MKNKYFVVRSSGVHGKGAFALKDIRKGTRLVEYVGENITPEESDKRYDDTGVKNHHTFLFSVDKRKVIDATFGGNESRFINHSCDPNCEAIIEKRRVYIEAMRTIRKGEELAYDYNYERTPKTTKADERLYKCLCGSDACRGTILSATVTLPKKAKKKAAKKSKQSSTKKSKKTKPGAKKKSGRGR
ncbi:MAG TPA: SET domain-containing protein-lysine N-methyltransferase [Gemmatimonadaceae bacterium]|nr:SET domain-containing protein-lysine N-methyltransferase [Gemmatimonadaceae bacterium]